MTFVLLITVCAFCTLLSAASVWIATRGRNRLYLPQEDAPPVSVLKPLCGADDSLEANLESFFVQDYPDFELVFGVKGGNDPAVEVVRKLKKRHPRVRCRLAIHEGGRGLNPKVDNLRAMIEAGTHDLHDLVVISDSNVCVRPDYLNAMVAHMDGERVGLVTSPIVGVGERSLGATLENLQLAGTIGGSVAASSLLGRTLVVGKSMMFRRSIFERLGGFSSVANLLAEDYVIGRMFRQAGFDVRLCPAPILNVVERGTLSTFVRRHLRWSMLRVRLKPLMYPLEPLTNPMFLALAAPFLCAGVWPVLLGAALSMSRDGLSWLRLRGHKGLLAALPLSPLKDLLQLAIWAAAPFCRHVGWRGNRLRLSAGTRLYAQTPADMPGPCVSE